LRYCASSEGSAASQPVQLRIGKSKIFVLDILWNIEPRLTDYRWVRSRFFSGEAGNGNSDVADLKKILVSNVSRIKSASRRKARRGAHARTRADTRLITPLNPVFPSEIPVKTIPFRFDFAGFNGQTRFYTFRHTLTHTRLR
tara:strand:- start:127 stop:552 length:426 start_codon:yes stop_codon:yes gene_type:complete